MSGEATGTVADCSPSLVTTLPPILTGAGATGICVVLTPTGYKQTSCDYHNQQISHDQGFSTLVITS